MVIFYGNCARKNGIKFFKLQLSKMKPLSVLPLEYCSTITGMREHIFCIVFVHCHWSGEQIPSRITSGLFSRRNTTAGDTVFDFVKIIPVDKKSE